MANFPSLTLTSNGVSIQTKAQAGQALVFTRVAVGDGTPVVEIADLTALANQMQSLDITSISVVEPGTSKLRTAITNAGLETGYYVRELGLFANDPDDDQEYLYGYTNAGEESDYLPAAGTTVVEQTIDLYTLVGEAENVSAVINASLVFATIQDIYDNKPAIVRRPLNINPAADAVTTRYPALAGGPYYPLHTIPQTARHFEIFDNAAGTGEPLYSATENAASESAPALTHTPDDPLTESTEYWWRYRDETALGEYSAYSEITRFETAAVYVETPIVTAPADSATDIGETPTVTISAFSVFGGVDTHTATQVQILLTSDDSLVYDSGALGPVTTHNIPSGNLEDGETSYKVLVRYQGDEQGWSEWSAANTFITPDEFITTDYPGGPGFGVGIYPGSVPAGFTALAGYDDAMHANYGNYQYSDGSVMCFIPAFYYRFGNAESPRYAEYGANALDLMMKAGSGFASRAEAAINGYALHRAFIDGGEEKTGFFIDKYLCSKNATYDLASSVINSPPLALTDTGPDAGLKTGDIAGMSGTALDAVTLSRARGTGFTCESVFQRSALSLMSLAHAQASVATTYCAWFDAASITNYPKGCNSSLSDIDDISVSYTSAGDSFAAGKPLTGSGLPVAKTTHNGQACGVTDINGTAAQALIGITTPGADGASVAIDAGYDAYVLKPSVAIASLTEGFGGASTLWGTAGSLLSNYDLIEDLLFDPEGATSLKMGNGGNQVFNSSDDGVEWIKTSSCLPNNLLSLSASGSNVFGTDLIGLSKKENLIYISGGIYSGGTNMGVFYRGNISRQQKLAYASFRAAFYAD